MCSIFVSTTTTTNMDNYQGDLTDILRASSTANSGGGTSSASDHQQPAAAAAASLQQHHHHDNHHHHHQWNNHHQFSSSDNSMSFSSILQDPREGSINYFGDPFSTLRDPFLQELDLPTPTPSSYFTTSTTNNTIISTGLEQQLPSAATSSSSVFGHNKVVLEDPTILQHEMRSSTSSSTSRPCKNIFSNMIQISPNPNNTTKLLPYDAPSPRPINKPSVVLSPNITINAANKDSLLDNNNNTAGIQISSSRNTGLKRRKNQAKKVVCIPAPAAANSRQTGEVVPSDLWAWRKYGQKPIKGSPYPRGYYRCSSSKGCSARKQVERSRTDPNMLVITYTSEHNHPWPTQRNALAGSTRSQPSKSNPSQKNSETSQKGTKNPKEEENNNSDGNNNSTVVKEEMEDIERQIEMDDGEFSDGVGVLPYKSSSLMENNLPHEDFFAELGELEGDPLNLLFNQGFGTNDHQKESKALDPFHLFDWSENSNNSNSFEEPNKRRL